MKDVLHTFLDFEKAILEKNIQYKGMNIWPILRTPIFEELINEVNDLNGLPGNTYKHKIKFFTILSRILVLFSDILSLRNLFKKADILIISNQGRNQTIENKKTNKLLWTFSTALDKKYNLLAINTQITDITESNVPYIQFSILLSIFTRIRSLFPSGNSWKSIEDLIGGHINEYYSVNVDWRYLYIDNYCRQVSLAMFIKCLIRIKSPKLILFSDNGAMGVVNRVAKDLDTKTMDYQHAITTDFHVMYTHNATVDKDYKQYLSEYFFAWGSYNIERYKEFYKCKIGGNAFFDLEKSTVENVPEVSKMVLIVSDDQLTRSYLEDLSKYLSLNLPDYTIFYKLRPEEYQNWKEKYSEELIAIDNLKFIDNDNKSLYFYLKQSEYVIGTSSSVLIEALPFANVIVYQKGWSSVMNQYIKDQILLSASSKEDVLRIIQEGIEIVLEDREDIFFKKDSLLLTKKIIDEICAS